MNKRESRQRLFVVEDHAIMRAALCDLLDAQPDLRVIGRAATGEEAIEELGGLEPVHLPDLVLVDLSLPGMSGDRLIRHLLGIAPLLRTLVVSGHDAGLYARAAQRAGAWGYVMKDDFHEVLQAVRAVLAGERFGLP